jgi:AraC-like DNA-binding protein
MISPSVDYIKEIDIVKQFKDSLSEFSGLDLDIFDIKSNPIHFYCSLKDKKDASCLKLQTGKCNLINQVIIDEFVAFKTTRMFRCPYSMAKMIVPLLLNDEVIGMVVAGENGSIKIDKARLNALSRLLSKATSYIIENESHAFKYFKRNIFTRQQQLLQRVIKYIRSNYHRNDLTLQEVAAGNGVSYHYLSHLFKKELNTTFVKFRQNIKMDLAAKLLKNFGLSIGQVSYACGFQDQSYFSKVFKASYECSPEDYRKKLTPRKTAARKNQPISSPEVSDETNRQLAFAK